MHCIVCRAVLLKSNIVHVLSFNFTKTPISKEPVALTIDGYGGFFIIFEDHNSHQTVTCCGRIVFSMTKYGFSEIHTRKFFVFFFLYITTEIFCQMHHLLANDFQSNFQTVDSSDGEWL